MEAAGISCLRFVSRTLVASTSLGDELDLQSIALGLDGAEYEPEQFPGLIYRLKQPKTAILLFRSGKVVCTGAKSMNEVEQSILTVSQQIKKGGQKINMHPRIEVQNIVASSDLGSEINLNAIAVTLGLDRVEYEPEQFPGLVCRIEEPRVVVLLFGSGKLVCTGARKPSRRRARGEQDYRRASRRRIATVGPSGGGVSLPADLPVVDHHCHLSPGGEGVEAARRFHREGGSHLFLTTHNWDHRPLRSVADYQAQFESIEQLGHRIRSETPVTTSLVVAPYPVHLLGLADALGLAKAVEIQMQGLDLAGQWVRDHRAVALGEVGWPHFAIAEDRGTAARGSSDTRSRWPTTLDARPWSTARTLRPRDTSRSVRSPELRDWPRIES